MTVDPQRSDVVADLPRTGDGMIDDALQRLARGSDLGLAAQAELYDAMFRVLQDRLADVDG